MASVFFSLRFFFSFFWREKNLSPGFGVMVFFGLGRFFFKKNLLVGRHVEINLKLIHMASGVKIHTLGRHVENSLRIANMAFWV
jgi:hypothetical protein